MYVLALVGPRYHQALWLHLKVQILFLKFKMNPPYRNNKRVGVYLRHSVSQPELESRPNVNQENAQKGPIVASAHLVSPQKIMAESPQRVHKMPASFNPREAKNMPLVEKITTWLCNIPWFQGEDGVWYSDCYPGHASSSTCNSDDVRSTSDHLDILEKQARKITRMTTDKYLYNGEATARPLTNASEGSYQRYSDDGYLYQYAQIDIEENSDFT